ncbi:MFS transporter [Paraburkholderia sp. SIMBA_054]|uniref:MFS transporter n=1 Tax=Paraburkholderia sp. SIMBA_054 TaxID=3085795 RepID=UPI0039797EB3
MTRREPDATIYTGEFREETYRKVMWRLLPLLFPCYVLNYLDRVNIGYSQLRMGPDLAFSDGVYGLGASMFFVGFVLFEIPSNLLLEKSGIRTTILRIMVLWGLLSAATIFVRRPAEFYLVWFLLGVAEAGFFPGIMWYLTLWFPPQRRARVAGIIMTAAVVAGMIAGPISGWILHNTDGLGGLASWQWLYLIEGLPSCILGVVTFFALPLSPSKASWLSENQRKLIVSEVSVSSPKIGATSKGVLIALKSSTVWMYSFLYFTIGCGAYALSFWMPSMIQGLRIADTRIIGLVSTIPYTFGAIVMVWYGYRSDRKHERRWHLAVAILVAAATLTATTLTTTHVWLSVALISVAVGGVVAAYPVFWAAATAAVPRAAPGASIAAITSIGNLSGVATPLTIGVLKAWSGNLSIGLYCTTIMMVVGLPILFQHHTQLGKSASA